MISSAPMRLKWIAILPIAIAAYILTYVVLKIVFYLYAEIASKPDGFLVDQPLPALFAFFGGYVFVQVGVRLAPGYKNKTSMVLLAVICIVSVIAIITGWFFSSWTILQSVAQAVGGAMAIVKLGDRGVGAKVENMKSGAN